MSVYRQYSRGRSWIGRVAIKQLHSLYMDEREMQNNRFISTQYEKLSLKMNEENHSKTLTGFSVLFNLAAAKPHEAHGSVLRPLLVYRWQHQSIKMDSADSSVHFTEGDAGQMDSAFGCVPQAFRKAPRCFTNGNICFGKVAFNGRTQREPGGTEWWQTDGLLWFVSWLLVWRYHSFNGIWSEEMIGVLDKGVRNSQWW